MTLRTKEAVVLAGHSLLLLPLKVHMLFKQEHFTLFQNNSSSTAMLMETTKDAMVAGWMMPLNMERNTTLYKKKTILTTLEIMLARLTKPKE